MVMMVVVGRLGFVQPRYLIAAGAAHRLLCDVDLLRITADVDYWYFAWSRIYLGIGMPLIFIPITTASYDGIPPAKTRWIGLDQLGAKFRRHVSGVARQQPISANAPSSIRSALPRR